MEAKVITTEIDGAEEQQSIVIDGEQIVLGKSFPQRRSRFDFKGALICEMALIRKIVLQDLTSVRLELVPDGQKFSVENIQCSDKFVDEFDLINKVRMVRIAQDTEPGKRFVLEVTNDTDQIKPVTTRSIVPDLVCSEVQLARLMPGKTMRLLLDVVEGSGQTHSTFAPVFTVFHREHSSLRGVNQQSRYYDVTQHEMVVENDAGLENQALLARAIELMVERLSQENVRLFKQLPATGYTSLLFTQLGFHEGAVLHFILLKLFPEASLTLTQDHPSEKGLLIRFVKPRELDVIGSMLSEVSRMVAQRWA